MAFDNGVIVADPSVSESPNQGGVSVFPHQRFRLLGLLRLLAGFAFGQLLIQALGFLSGILIVRALTKDDYAWFTVANTFIATMNLIADSGISGALTAVGGVVWQDNARFGSLIRTALTLRRKFAIVSIVVVAPALIWMLAKNQAPAPSVAVIVLLASLTLLLQLTSGVLGTVLSLRQELLRVQLLGLGTALLRLVMLAIACAIFIDVRISLFAGLCAMVWHVWLLRRWVSASVEWNAPPSAEYRTRILSVVKKQAPLTLFYCFQGQVTVWLVSIFGNTQSVADVGALGRFSMIFTVIYSVISGVVIPRFARCNDLNTLRCRYLQIAVVFSVLAGTIVFASAHFSRLILSVLGSTYSHLEGEVWLVFLSGALTGLFGVLTGLTYSKGWILPAVFSIPLELITQVTLISILDISTLRGVLYLSCMSSVPLIVMTVVFAQLKMRECQRI